jgi:hypothetical protein
MENKNEMIEEVFNMIPLQIKDESVIHGKTIERQFFWSDKYFCLKFTDHTFIVYQMQAEHYTDDDYVRFEVCQFFEYREYSFLKTLAGAFVITDLSLDEQHKLNKFLKGKREEKAELETYEKLKKKYS